MSTQQRMFVFELVLGAMAIGTALLAPRIAPAETLLLRCVDAVAVVTGVLVWGSAVLKNRTARSPNRAIADLYASNAIVLLVVTGTWVAHSLAAGPSAVVTILNLLVAGLGVATAVILLRIRTVLQRQDTTSAEGSPYDGAT